MKSLLILAALLPSLALAEGKPAAACPKVAEQLPELLAGAMQRLQQEEGLVRVEYEVTAEGRVRALSIDGHRQYRTPVRIALSSLDCHAGQAQRYVLDVRFARPQPRAAATALAAASSPDQP